MASIVAIQNALNAGELSPSMYGRTDVDKWHKGTSTCRNFFSDYRGGVQSRPGLQYVGTSLSTYDSTGNPPRLIPFQFNISQGYVLEFGEGPSANPYVRFIFQGGYITETPVAITGITKANPGVFHAVAHGYVAGQWVTINNVVGMTEFNGLTFRVFSVPDADHFTLDSLLDFSTAINTTNYSAYVSGGTAARIYQITSPYASADLPFLKYTQSADVMTLTCVNAITGAEYPPYDLARLGNTNWVFTQETFASTIASPTGVTGTALSSSTLTTWYSYVVTAVDSKTGEESNPSTAFNIQNNDIAIYAGTNSISWNKVPNASSYNVYSATPSYSEPIAGGNLYGFIGTSFGTNFNDTNIQPDFTTVPPIHFNPFSRGAVLDVVPTAVGINYSQQTVGYNITTAAGTGFAGVPVVTNGGVSGFVITNQGQGYNTGDTIAFTDSGGGIATGNITYASNIATGTTFALNGLTMGLQPANDTNLGPFQIAVGNTLAITLQNIATYCNASSNGDLNVAIYTANATQLIINYKLPGAVGNLYTLDAGTTTGVVSAGTLTGGGTVGSGATANLVFGPQTGTFPSTVAYYQQRRVYANSLTQPDTFWMSQPGLFHNMDTSTPTTSADSITGTPWAQQVNGIQFTVPMPGGLVVLTGKGAWQVNGGSQAAITPSDENATPQAYNGCHFHVPPITINYDILYVQAKGSLVRDLSYNFFVNIYTGTDLTVYSNHLFSGYQIQEWAYAEEPYKLVWAVRSDGTLLCLTYLREQEVFAWTRHDTNGLFASVAVVTEIPSTVVSGVDAVYFAVKRYVQGAWRYYIERMSSLIPDFVENSVCSDACLLNQSNFPNATLQPSAATGTITATASSAVLNSGMVGDILRVDGGIGVITAVDVTNTILTVNLTQDIANTVPNDLNNTPLQALPGFWSVTTPITQVGGLNHLNGMEVCILADGSVVPNQTVSEVAPGVFGIILPQPATVLVIGLPYVCQLQTLYIDHPEKDTIQTKRKNISAVGLRVAFGRGIQVGADQPDASAQQYNKAVPWTNMNEIKDRTNSVFAGNAVPLFTGDYYKAITSGWDVRGQVAVQLSYPLPAKILSIVSYFTVGDDRG